MAGKRNNSQPAGKAREDKPQMQLQLQTISKPDHQARVCPVDGSKGKEVPGQTVKALLKVSLRLVKEAQYYFCPAPHCPVVYFSYSSSNSNENLDGNAAAGQGQTFTKDQVRVAVFQKEPDNPLVEVCYCFGYSLGGLRLATTAGQKETILADIREGIARGQCACDLRNPQGGCCLGNVARLLKSPA
jgi:hypothetical protein